MTDMTGAEMCDADHLAQLVERLATHEAEGLSALQAALRDWPGDPRLHFLQGSFLAGNQDYAAAVSAMRRAVDLAPQFDLARFQLGFLLLTSGQAYAAQEAWGPLYSLPPGTYLRLFVEGLSHLIRDEFSQAVAALEDGIGRNDENEPMNADMRLIIAGIDARDTDFPSQDDANAEPVSAAQMLWQQAALKSTRH